MRAAQRQGGGAVSGSSARSFRSATGFDWLTEADFRAFGRSWRLSDRQIQVMTLDCQDVKRPAIARRLGLQPHTINTHLDRLHKRLGVKDRFQILAMVARSALQGHRPR